MMLRWKYRDNAKCPRCDETEDTHHVVQCQSEGNLRCFEKATEDIREWLDKTTSSLIKSAVMDHVQAYQRNEKVNGLRTTDIRTWRVSVSQDDLGVRSFGEGFLAPGWKDLQTKFYGGRDGEVKSQRWVVKLIQKIWEVSWNMWESRNDLIHNEKSVREDLFMAKVNATIEV
jgi:hypothetical protein